MEIKIRKLYVKDCRFLMGLMRKLITEGKEAWIELIVCSIDAARNKEEATGTEDGQKYFSVFSKIINVAFEKYEGDVTGWFASLAEMEVDDYLENASFGADLIIMEQLKEAPDFKDFFSKACAVFNVQKLSENLMSSAKRMFASMIDLQDESSESLNTLSTSSEPNT